MELLAETPVKTLASVASDQPAKIAILGVGELSGKVRTFSVAINPTTQLGQIFVFIAVIQSCASAPSAARPSRRTTLRPSIRCRPCSTDPPAPSFRWFRDNRIETARSGVGLLAGGQAEVREGLAEGEMVVARAGAFVREEIEFDP